MLAANSKASRFSQVTSLDPSGTFSPGAGIIERSNNNLMGYLLAAVEQIDKQREEVFSAKSNIDKRENHVGVELGHDVNFTPDPRKCRRLGVSLDTA